MIQQPALGIKISDLRKAKGLTQEELVDKCNLSVRTLQRIEAGEVTPRPITIKLIFDALEVSFEEIMQETAEKKWTTQFYNSIIELFNLKTDTVRKIIILFGVAAIIILVSIFLATEIKSRNENKNHAAAKTLTGNTQSTDNNRNKPAAETLTGHISDSTTISAHSQNSLSEQQKTNSFLENVYQKLNSFQQISYDLTRELSYSTEDYHNISLWKCYYDFDFTNAAIPFCYQIEDSTSKNIFNGIEKFELKKAEKTYQVSENPPKEVFQQLPFFYNSLITLRRILPLVIADQSSTKTIADTVFNNQSCKLVTINTGKRRILNLGEGFETMHTKYDFIYKIIVDKNNHLPMEVLQKNNRNHDFVKTSFSNINLNPKQPSDSSWCYSTYKEEYKPAEYESIPKLLPVGSFAPEWKLETFSDDNKQLFLSNFKNKVIVLDFWIKNCGPCILSVPHLNKLYETFKDDNFELLSINSYDSKKDVKGFRDRHGIKYPTLLNGKTVAKEYGVSGFPSFFVIDKSGKIIYSQVGFDESIITKIEKIIKDAL